MEGHGHHHHHNQNQHHRHHQGHQPHHVSLKKGFSKINQFFKKPNVQKALKIAGIATAVITVGCLAAVGIYCMMNEDSALNNWMENLFSKY